MMTSEAFAISEAYRSSTMRAARRSRSSASPRNVTPCRTMNSSVSANTIMVITVDGPPISPRAKYTSTRKAASIAAYGRARAGVSELFDMARAGAAMARIWARPAAATGA